MGTELEAGLLTFLSEGQAELLSQRRLRVVGVTAAGSRGAAAQRRSAPAAGAPLHPHPGTPAAGRAWKSGH